MNERRDLDMSDVEADAQRMADAQADMNELGGLHNFRLTASGRAKVAAHVKAHHPLVSQAIVYTAHLSNGEVVSRVYDASNDDQATKLGWNAWILTYAASAGEGVAIKHVSRKVANLLFEGDVQHIHGSITTYGVELSMRGAEEWYVKDSGIETEVEATRIAKSWLPYQDARVVEHRRRVVNHLDR